MVCDGARVYYACTSIDTAPAPYTNAQCISFEIVLLRIWKVLLSNVIATHITRGSSITLRHGVCTGCPLSRTPVVTVTSQLPSGATSNA
jgi:hypothetical protein